MVLYIQNVPSACTSKNTIDMVDDIDIKDFRDDPLGWTMKLLKHPFREFSMAAVQANEDMEDFIQVEIGNDALFVGIYDGQNGVIASEYMSNSFFPALLWILYIANVGDSHAVMGSLGPFDILRVWQLGGRCIGNAYLKRARFTLMPSFKVPRTELAPSDFTRPLLSTEPKIYSRVLRDNDKFIIFGSGGLWKLLTNKEAAKIVNTNPRQGIAKRLVRIALEIAARQKNISYSELLKVSKDPSVSVERTRRSYHDDIFVTVVFLDKKPDIDMSVMPNVIPSVPRINSFRSFYDKALFSNFRFMYTRDREPMVIHSTLASDAILY
ncbi:unnamed protein product [Vicia faba]|uniref:PPM-type phosphatase domain-containing protein n=1 Tax=Vicia faba TaxID=3906 RepID=A0AAV1AXT5_VICFA|nr:unnamed protein product [Vicia faba]